ncbi:hypothetical protein [Beijerinckia sp. L45]|uniref:hypothetical protein n=1 Tax=Beijerinckia sp. L45 TaxID=1641855 RepID=UPI00131D11EE|nr:hypothetical protein [Beijerinckia sp. L45]
MLGTGKAKSQQSLERAIAKYQTKLAKAVSPSQRQYAASMLRMAEQALAKSRDGQPVRERDGDDTVNLSKDEYEIL